MARYWLTQLVAILVLAALGAAGWGVERLWPRHFTPTLPPSGPIVAFDGDRLALRARGAALAAEVGNYGDELLAHLNYQYLRSRVPQQYPGSQILLSQTSVGQVARYHIYLVLPNNLLAAFPFLSQLETEGYISHYTLIDWSHSNLAYHRTLSQMLEASYNLPVNTSLDSLNAHQLVGLLTRFILFKSRTDRRVRERIAPVPPPLTPAQARRQAEDIITVARFYSLPTDAFIGMAAQENNYLHADGDLSHAVWKRRPARGDIVIARRHGWVLVRDYSIGVWQITRETLRYAHLLYLQDSRDYTLLPARLRPSKVLNLDATRPEVLTTYAGLLFRRLLDRFNGNVALALGAYNGGWGSPNLEYSANVSLTAGYAREMIEQAAALHGWRVVPVTIVPFSAPPKVIAHPTLLASAREAANELTGKIVNRIRNSRERNAPAPEEAANDVVGNLRPDVK